MLQKIIFEQVEKSQATEDGFQKIREVNFLLQTKKDENKIDPVAFLKNFEVKKIPN